MQIASLFARIGLKTDEEKAKSFVRSMGRAKATLIAVGTAVTATSAAIVKVTSDALDAAAAFKQFEVETGASAQELQRWQAVAEQTNSSAEAVSQAIRAITSNQEAIRLGQGNISGFQLLGIDPRQDPFQILEQLRDRTDGLSQAMKRNVLAQMGIGAGLLQTLELSSDQFDELAGRAFIISPTAIETLARTRGIMNQAARGVEFLKAQIAVGLAPQIEDLTRSFIEFIKQNEEGIINGFRRSLEIVRRFGRAIGTAARFLNDAIQASIGWENALKIVAATLVALNASLLLSPIGLFTAGIILLIALLEDIAVYQRGGQSLLGVLFEEFPQFEAMIQGLADRFQGLRENIEAVVEAVRNFIRLTFDREARLEAGTENIEGIREQREGFTFRQGVQNLREGLQTVGELFRGEQRIGDLIRQSRETGAPLLQPNQAPVTNNNTLNVTVNGAQDPRSTADEIQRLQQRQWNAASAQRGRNE